MHNLFEIPSITLFLCAFSWLTGTVFSRLQIKIRPKGLHSFAFYILIFDFPPCLCVFCASLWLINPFNQRNLRLINDLRSTKDYVRKNNLFLQNKAKFRKVKLNVNKVLTTDYEQMDTWSIGTKQSQTNPNKAKLKKAEMNVTPIITKGYENKPPIRAPKKQSQTSKQQKPMQTLLLQRIMENTAISASEKTNPNKANFKANIMLISSGKCRLKVILALVPVIW